VKVLDIAPGFVIQNGEVLREVLRRFVRAQELRSECAESMQRANRYDSVDEAEVERVAALLRENMEICAEYLRSYSGD
jgi:hypothetical protein